MFRKLKWLLPACALICTSTFTACGGDDPDDPYSYDYPVYYPGDNNDDDDWGDDWGDDGDDDNGGTENPGGDNPGGDNPGGNNPGGQTTQKPAAPTGLYATPDGPSTNPFAMLKWNRVSNADSYTIYRSNSAYGSYSRIGTSQYASYSDQNVKYGNTYYYKVTATNSAGTSDYSDYAQCEFSDRRKPGPVNYGNCTVSGGTMTLRWSVPRDPSYGTPDKAILRVRHPDTGDYVDLQTLSGTATSVSFSFGMWIDSNGYVYAGIVLENSNGTGGGIPKVYNTKTKKWEN